jgi:hypothetical protein
MQELSAPDDSSTTEAYERFLVQYQQHYQDVRAFLVAVIHSTRPHPCLQVLAAISSSAFFQIQHIWNTLWLTVPEHVAQFLCQPG